MLTTDCPHWLCPVKSGKNVLLETLNSNKEGRTNCLLHVRLYHFYNPAFTPTSCLEIYRPLPLPFPLPPPPPLPLICYFFHALTAVHCLVSRTSIDAQMQLDPTKLRGFPEWSTVHQPTVLFCRERSDNAEHTYGGESGWSGQCAHAGESVCAGQ